MENYTPNITGYESDALSEYAQSNFTDVLLTSFSDTAALLNYDLSESKNIKCIIQNNTADTRIKSSERQILCAIGTLKAGMYLYFDNCFWLITGYPGNNKVYEKATAILCQYKLKWQKSDGTTIERWCNLSSAAKYDIGESGNNTLTLTTNNFTILIPNDEDSMTIEGKRVFIDKNKSDPNKVFKITRSDDSIYEYGVHGGILSLIADKTELNKEKDSTEFMLCDYIPPSLPYPATDNITSRILGPPAVKLHFPQKFNVVFSDTENKKIQSGTVNYRWNLRSNFPDRISCITENDTICIQVDDSQLINESFLLQVLVNGNLSAEVSVLISGIY